MSESRPLSSASSKGNDESCDSARPSARLQPKFDGHAGSYEEAHAASIKASGETTTYFAEYKLRCLERIGAQAPILDFGCGIGNLTEQLVKAYRVVHGYDPSSESLLRAEPRAPGAVFHHDLDQVPDATFATAIVAGVLHHVVPSERAELLGDLKSKLLPGGRIVVFEHNPINPLTRQVVANCTFDDDAVLLWPWQVKRVLREAGFVDVDLRYIVFFPKFLAALRHLEPKLSRLFVGAQTMCTATKPA